MKVAHLFDKYLNITMNWAYRLIKLTPNTKSYIAAPIIVDNRFFDESFEYIEEPFQSFFNIKKPKNEWNISKIRYYWYAFALRTFYPYYVKSVIVREKIEVLHAHFAHVGVAFMSIAERTKIPLIVSFYGTDYERLPFEQPKYRKLYKILFEKATFLICEGENGVRLLEKMGCPKEKIRIVKLGIDSSTITYFTKEKRPNQLKIIQAATFTETKGFIYTISAFAEALKTCPNMSLTLVGEKWEKIYVKEVLQLIDNLGISENITILNFVENNFHEFLSQFDVFIHPSCYSKVMECEGGAPIVLLDAQAVGLPIISTTHCDIPSEVLHEKTGLLTPEKDISALAKSIASFYNMDNETYQTFSKRARQHVENEYDSEKNSKILRTYYEEAISKGQ
jgi:colanic acid/amylovoran biosynthesis glycosyltransferase